MRLAARGSCAIAPGAAGGWNDRRRRSLLAGGPAAADVRTFAAAAAVPGMQGSLSRRGWPPSTGRGQNANARAVRLLSVQALWAYLEAGHSKSG